MKKVGFIGLGNMGLPMANNILNAGIGVNAFDLSRDAMKRADELGMVTKSSASDVIENIDASNFTGLGELLNQLRPSIVVNCVGIVKQRMESKDR